MTTLDIQINDRAISDHLRRLQERLTTLARLQATADAIIRRLGINE